MANKKQADQHALLADVPISSPKHDVLGRSPFAKALARTIRSMKGDDSFVFALCGPWGSGKSSVLRMVVHELEKGKSATKPEIVTFNPWWFSGQDQLLQGFLSQLSAVLGRNDTGKRTTTLGERIGTLGKVLRPFGWIPGAGVLKDAGEMLEKAGEATAGLGQQLSADVQQVRTEIDDLLRSRKRRIVVVMDDIDRLTASEIAQLFLIVKAVADFPNTVYLLAFDPEVVCKAIGEKLGLDGAAYLEKIVQVQLDLPSVGPIPLQQMFLSQLGLLLSEELATETSQYDFASLFHEGLKEFLQTPRAVKRVVNVLRVLYPAVAGEVYWPDFVGIISLMVFAPSVFRLVRDNPERFSGAGNWERGDRDEETKFHEQWRDRLPEDQKRLAVGIMCKLFPKVEGVLGDRRLGGDWESRARANLRISSSDIFPRYFQLSIPVGAISEAEWNKVIGMLSQQASIDTYVERLCKEKGQHGRTSRAKEFLERANIFAKYRATIDQAKMLFEVMLRKGDVFVAVEDSEMVHIVSIDNGLRVWWVMQAAFLRIEDQSQREAFLESCLGGEIGLYSAAQLVWVLGSQYGKFASSPRDSREAPFVSDACVDRMVGVWLSHIDKAAADGSLLQHPKSMFIAREWRAFGAEAKAQEWVSAAASDDRVLVGFIEQLRSVAHSQGMGDSVARRHQTVDAEHLTTWFDGIDLRKRCERLLKNSPDWRTKEQSESLRILRRLIGKDGTVLDLFERKRQRLMAGKSEDDEDVDIGEQE